MTQRRRTRASKKTKTAQTVKEKGEETENRDHSTRQVWKLGVRKNRVRMKKKRRHAKYK